MNFYQLTHIRENGATSGVGVLATFSYDDQGRRTALDYGNGTTTSYDYDALGRLDELVQDLSGTTHDNTDTFAFNPAGQIASRTRTNTGYSYAAHINVDTLFGHNGLNQITSVTGSPAPTYDGRGNMTSDGSTTFGYDQYNRLVSASGGVTLDYDPAGRLYEYVESSITRRFQYDGVALIAEYNTSGTVETRYVHGPGIDAPLVEYDGSGTGNRSFLHADARGSIIAHTDSSGVRTAVLSYDEYGNPASTNTGRFQYTGQLWLEGAGVYHYKNRAYHPGMMRFLQADPIGVAGGINLYAYVGGDPVNFVDPSGLFKDPNEVSTDIDSGYCQPWDAECGREEYMRALMEALNCSIDPGLGAGAYPLLPAGALGTNFGNADDPANFAVRFIQFDPLGIAERAQNVSAETDREIAFVFDQRSGVAILMDARMGAPGSGVVAASLHPNPAEQFVWVHFHGSDYPGAAYGLSPIDMNVPGDTVVYERNGDILYSDGGTHDDEIKIGESGRVSSGRSDVCY